MAEKIIYYLPNGNVKIKEKEYSKEDVYNLYITQDNSILELADILGIKKSSVSNILKKMQLSKAKEAGVLYYTQSSKFKQRSKETNLKKYGVEYAGQSSVIKDKIKATCLEKYGVEYSTQTQQMKEKSKETIQQHYGVSHISQSEEIKEKVRQTNLDKYGVGCSLQNPEIKKQIIKTNLKKYGAENPFANKEVQQKIRQSLLKKYGVESFKQKDIEHIDIWKDRELFVKYIEEINKEHKPNIMELCHFFNCEQTSLYKKIHEYQIEEKIDWYLNRSYYEDDIIDWLQKNFCDIKIIRNERSILGNNLEIDIYLPEYKIGIEFNGNYWHSELFEKFQDHNGRSTRHQEKSLIAEEKGILLFQIFEYEWNSPIVQENIKNRLRTLLQKNNNLIYARKCEVKLITEKQKKDFLNLNHIQGNDRSSVYIGLFYENKLVSCMTFSKPKFQKYDYELSRFCSIHDTNVIGGASKMFKFFVDTFLLQGQKVVSYNDITKTSGKIYSILGFVNTSINPPNYIWMNLNTGEIRTRYQEQKAGEVQRMHSQGFSRICDCGTKTWLYIKK